MRSKRFYLFLSESNFFFALGSLGAGGWFPIDCHGPPPFPPCQPSNRRHGPWNVLHLSRPRPYQPQLTAIFARHRLPSEDTIRQISLFKDPLCFLRPRVLPRRKDLNDKSPSSKDFLGQQHVHPALGSIAPRSEPEAHPAARRCVGYFGALTTSPSQ